MPNPIVPNILVAVRGEPKSGKTYFAFTFPDPIFVISLDERAEFLAQNKFPAKKIDLKTYDMPIVNTLAPQPWAMKFWDNIAKDLGEAIKSGKYKTVVIDTGSALYTIARAAYTEELGQKNIVPRDYGEVYMRMTVFWKLARRYGVNLVVTHYVKEEYRGDKGTGNMILDGMKPTEGLADLCVDMTCVNTDIIGKVYNCGFDPKVNGFSKKGLTYNTLLLALGVDVGTPPPQKG